MCVQGPPAAEAHYLDMQQAAPVMRCCGGNADGTRPPAFDQRGKSLFGVLPGQRAHAGHVFLTRQLVQARTQRRIGPPAAERGHQAQVDGVCQRVDAFAGVVAGRGIKKSVHAPDSTRHMNASQLTHVSG